jgi:rhamnopyranosyl-N-acetylglucosaminyl-diphospho-decaprenol beta-1,3/1,4-galactofuranosyltransferase
MSTVCAIVVTYNRLGLLRQCIEALRNQTRKPDAIVVVDNGSIDETPAWLREQPGLTVVTQTNTGSGGGQNRGIGWASAQGYDWFWCMDDDGLPAPDCLARLLEGQASHGFDVVNPLVVDRDNPGLLSFRLPGGEHAVEDVWKLAPNGVIIGYVVAFNGTMIARHVITRIGNVKREMFIWGDEMEFIHRLRKARLRIGTMLDAEHRHPASRILEVKVLWGMGTVFVAGERMPIYARNLGYIYPRYFGFVSTLKQLIKYTVFILSSRPSRWINLKVFYRYFLDGALDRYALAPDHRSAGPFTVRESVPLPSRTAA